MPELRINTDIVCDLREVLRERAGLAASPDGRDTDGDDSPLATLVERPDDPRSQEIVDLLTGLNDDERTDLMALVLLGREDFTLREWGDAVTLARDRIGAGSTGYLAEFLLGDPNTPEFLGNGLDLLGKSCSDSP